MREVVVGLFGTAILGAMAGISFLAFHRQKAWHRFYRWVLGTMLVFAAGCFIMELRYFGRLGQTANTYFGFALVFLSAWTVFVAFLRDAED